jgi:glycosyltransferase involved in cell wall biosynthesis
VEAQRVRRVLLLTPRLLDTSGGRACTDLALRIDRSRFEPVVCCYAGWGPLAAELDREGIEIFPLRRRAGADVGFVISLAREVRRREIDVVHPLHADSAYVVGVLSALLAGAESGVASFRDRPSADSRLLTAVGRLCGELVDTVVATSDTVGESLLARRWVPPGKVRVLHEGVNIDRFEPAARREPARREWGIGEDVPVVGTVLQSHEDEELEQLCEAFAGVRRSIPDAELVVCGLRGGDERVTGLGPFADSPAFYAAIGVLCVPFARRTVPLTLLEGLAAGVPIAAARRHRHAGLAPEGPWAFANVTGPSSEELADGLVTLLRDPEAARALARGGRACVAEEHSIDGWVDSIQRLYEGRP